MIRCDADGIPKIVQKLNYLRLSGIWQATYFDGSRSVSGVEEITPELCLAGYSSEAEYLDAEHHFERNFCPAVWPPHAH